ncbi:glycosyltransferase family 2 protein [bacterium]|jgi:hypothetical protein|nr:glycosyltransferase family 2 protein [bacterium]
MLTAPRLSIIVRLYSGIGSTILGPQFPFKALAEKTVHSLLEQTDPIGTEIVITDGSTNVSDHLSSVFSEAVSQQRLQLVPIRRLTDPGAMWNQGAKNSRGAYLNFVDVGTSWKPGYLTWLEPLLKRHDLILSSHSPLGESTDWVRAFMSHNWLLKGSMVLRRSLFEQAGEFSENGLGLISNSEYELCLKCLSATTSDRMALTTNSYLEQPQSPLQLPELPAKLKDIKDVISLLHATPGLARRYWPALLRRLSDTVFQKKLK